MQTFREWLTATKGEKISGGFGDMNDEDRGMTCPHCGKELRSKLDVDMGDSGLVCGDCGKPIDEEPDEPEIHHKPLKLRCRRCGERKRPHHTSCP